jgi:hypothetical protein
MELEVSYKFSTLGGGLRLGARIVTDTDLDLRERIGPAAP